MISLVDYNLRIQNIQPHDGGQYTCYISTDGPVISVTHELQILGKILVARRLNIKITRF